MLEGNPPDLRACPAPHPGDGGAGWRDLEFLKGGIRVCKSGDSVSCHPAYGVETAPYQDLPVYLNCDGSDPVICIGAKSCIEASIGVKPGDVVYRYPANGGETTPYQDLSVCLNCDASDILV